MATTTSRRSNVPTTLEKAASSDRASDTSAVNALHASGTTGVAPPWSITAPLAPASANTRTMAAPIPFAPPVTTATRPGQKAARVSSPGHGPSVTIEPGCREPGLSTTARSREERRCGRSLAGASPLSHGTGSNAGPKLEVVVDGRPARAFAGETVAAVLIAKDGLRTRPTAGGAPRGIYCGMGVCFDCLVVVDGVPNTRACMTLVADGMRIERQSAWGLAD